MGRRYSAGPFFFQNLMCVTLIVVHCCNLQVARQAADYAEKPDKTEDNRHQQRHLCMTAVFVRYGGERPGDDCENGSETDDHRSVAW